MHKLSCRILLLLAIITVSGCESKPDFPIYSVKGLVKFTDGNPVSDGWIEFSSQAPETKGRNSNSRIAKDGTFEMETFARGKGAYAGPVEAVISTPVAEFDPEKGDVKKPEVNIPEKYRDYKTSGLTYQIEKKDNTLNITIERNGTKP